MFISRLATRRTWHATTHVRGRPEEVLAALTDPAACARWSGVAFTLRGHDGPRLTTGSRARVTGELVGRSVDFDLSVLEADLRRLRLRAIGPVQLVATYLLAPTDDGCQVEAALTVVPAAIPHGGVIAFGTQALLAAGALDQALARLAVEVEGDRRPAAVQYRRSAA